MRLPLAGTFSFNETSRRLYYRPPGGVARLVRFSFWDLHNGKQHKAVDVSTSVNGVRCLAMLRGTIERVARDVYYVSGRVRGYGLYMVLRTAVGSWRIYYAHLKTNWVGPGRPATEGQVIALDDNSGGSTGPHLHLEIRLGSGQIDPYGFLCWIAQGARRKLNPYPVPTVTLRYGAQGPVVHFVEWAVGPTTHSGTAAPATKGVFDPALTIRVKAFQKARGLAADGVVGPRTLSALKAVTR